MSNQRAFHNTTQIRQLHVERVLAHQLANEIMQGTSWREKASGAVGSTLESNQHSLYEEELGIPRQLAYLEDRIFEGLPNKEAKTFPFVFLTSIPVGADLSLVLARFMVWLLIDSARGVLRFVGSQGAAISAVAALYQRVIEGEAVSTQEWLSALSAASARGQAAMAAANAFSTTRAFSVAAAATSAGLAFNATVVAAAVAYISYATGEVDPAVTGAVTATVATLGYGNIAAVAADYGDAAAFIAAYGDDLAAFAGFAADRSAAACEPATENSIVRKAHYQAMRDKLLELLRAAPADERAPVPLSTQQE
ncbi:MAG TPA: hypothetical protein VGD98_07535 [Ktedonobacteraceae bacterium]